MVVITDPDWPLPTLSSNTFGIIQYPLIVL